MPDDAIKSEHYVLSRASVGRRGRGGEGRAGVAVILYGACREMLQAKRTKCNASELSMISCLEWQAKEYDCDARLLSFAEHSAKRSEDYKQAARESGSIAG